MELENRIVRLRSALYSITKIYGIELLRWYPCDIFDLYMIYILEYLEKQIILSGVADSDIKEKIDLFDQVYRDTMSAISEGRIDDIADEMGVTAELEYDPTKFSGILGSFISLTYLQLRYNYSYLFRKPEADCHACSNTSDDTDIEFNLLDPRPMQDGYEFGPGTQELWGDGFANT